MTTNRSSYAPLYLLAAFLAIGCDKPNTGLEDPASATGTARTAWDLAAVEASLRTVGLHPVRRTEPVRQSFMAVPATLLDLGTGEVQIYLYATHAARAHDTDRLDPNHVAPPHMMISWRMPPTLIVSDNLAAILLTHDVAMRDHVRKALSHPRQDR